MEVVSQRESVELTELQAEAPQEIGPSPVETSGNEGDFYETELDPEIVTVEGLGDDVDTLPTASAKSPLRHLPQIDEIEDDKEEVKNFSVYIEKLAPSTRRILEEDFKAHFVHLIRPKKQNETKKQRP